MMKPRARRAVSMFSRGSMVEIVCSRACVDEVFEVLDVGLEYAEASELFGEVDDG
jgi:hypothetical protein